MRIAVFLNGFPEKPDGNYTPAVIDLLCCLAREHEVIVFAIGSGRPAKKSIYEFNGIQVLATGPIRPLSGLVKLVWLWGKFIQFHRQDRFDMLHGLWHVGSVVAAAAAQVTRLPVVVSMMGGEVVNLPEIGYGVITRMKWRCLLRWSFRKADLVTAGSRFYLEKIRRFCPSAGEKMTLAPLGVSWEALPLRNRRSNGAAKVLTVAALQPVKNLPAILELADQVKRDGLEWHIAGQGDESTTILQQLSRCRLQDRVKLVGWRPSGEFKSSLGNYDLLVSTSQHEAQGMALLEAAGAGLPIISTRVGVAEELKELGAAILLIDSSSDGKETLTKALAKLPQLGRKATIAACSVREFYDLRRTTGHFVHLYGVAKMNKAGTAPQVWHRVKMPLWMRLLRVFRAPTFGFLAPIISHIRKRNADTVIAGLRLETRFDVFHPKFFFSSAILGKHLTLQPLADKAVLDMGTGSGLVGIMAAKKGARVFAVDINPSAVNLAQGNAALHDVTERMCCKQSNLFDNVPAARKFDWIVFNPPFFQGEARGVEDAAWHGGELYETIDRFLCQARSFLSSTGKVLLILSSDMPLQTIDNHWSSHDYRVVAHVAREHMFEIFHLIELHASST